MTLVRNSLCPLLVLISAALSAAPAQAQARYLGWHTDLDEAAQVAKETGKPLFVVFRCER